MKTSLGAKTLLYPTPVLVVGTYDPQGNPNVMTAAWGGIACSSPPCVAVSLRAATASHGYIMARQAFTISLPAQENAAQADYIGIVSGRDHNKFQELGLTPVASDLVDAPYVGEFPFVIECKVIATHELGLHTQFVGEILDVKVNDDLLTDGNVNLELFKPIVYAPETRAYYALGEIVGKSHSIGRDLIGKG